ncbi:MAG: hypothetical protein IKF72_04170 [Kiritimatiellae bacterium]|nr:hypothetical protein [Kiritimatiellia bacterium]
MKKSLVAVFAGLMSAAAFAGMNNVLVSFSTVGPDKYADGTTVVDGECYALVWTPTGSAFAGINADGTAAGDSKVAIAAPVAKDGKCPSVTFQIDESYAAANFPGGTWGVYLLDTRKFKTDDDGVIIKDENGKAEVESVGGKIVNGFGAVQTLSDGKMASASADASVSTVTTSVAPEKAADLKINDIKFIGDNVYLYVSGSLSCLQYGLQSGDKPDNLSDAADGKTQYGNDDGDMIIITPKKPGAQFFKVNRK